MTDAPGDFDAFATSCAPALFRSALALSGDWHLAQDLVQDTLLQVHLKWRKVASVDNPVGYVQTMLVRNFLSQSRRRRSSERPVHPLPEGAAPAPDADLRLSLLAALQSLTHKDRVVLVLRYLEDKSAEQTAADLRSTAGAVRVRAHRALLQLREVLVVDPAIDTDAFPLNSALIKEQP